jgi:hypothetical protein
VIITVVPPAVVPVFGESAVTVGSGGDVNVLSEPLLVPLSLVAEILK